VRPAPGEVLHFSEDPTIERFVPHVAPTSRETEAYVWAVDGPRCPDGDLLALHEAAGIQLRLLPNLWPWWDEVIESTLGWSGIRLRNACPREPRIA
jgi:hypothetical protein